MYFTPDYSETENTTYRNVDYNLETLNNTYQNYQGVLGKYGIQSVALSFENNRVIVTYKNDSDLGTIKSLYDNKAVQFKKDSLDMITRFTTDVINGKAGGVTSGSSGRIISIGCRAKSSSTGKVGVLIPGHLFPATNTNIYYDGGSTVMGTTKQTQCSGSVDATFVQTNSTFIPTLNFADGDSYQYTSFDAGTYNLREGATVHLHGWTSGKTEGKIKNISYSETVSGINMTNMVKCDYIAIGGDSGGAVTYDRYIGSASSAVSVCGLQSFSNLSPTGAWISGTSYSCFSRIDNIFITLGLTDY